MRGGGARLNPILPRPDAPHLTKASSHPQIAA